VDLLGLRRGTEATEPDEAPTFWLSFADLMTGLVMVFILVLMVVLHWKKTELEQQQRLLNKQQLLLADKTKLLDSTRHRLEEVELRVKKMLGVRAELIVQLRNHFASVHEKVDVDPKTGAIRIGEAVLFDFNSDMLKPSGAKMVARVYEKLADVLFATSFPFNAHLTAISIEGHASKEKLKVETPRRIRKEYLVNLDLSQRRAKAVLAYLSNQEELNQEHLRHYAVAVGYGYSRLHNTSDPASPDNRRIEITFQLKDEDALREMRKLLNELGHKGE